MKNLTAIKWSLFFFGMLVFTSCKKEECHECHYDLNGQEVELGKKCDDELEAIEKSGFTSNGVVYEVHCHEH